MESAGVAGNKKAAGVSPDAIQIPPPKDVRRFMATIARNVTKTKSFKGRPLGRQQELELTEEDVARMHPKMVGLPFVYNHDITKKTGRISASYVRPNGQWDIEVEVDPNLSIHAADDLAWLEKGLIRGISLCHDPNNMEPEEASWCPLGAREGTWIYQDSNSSEYKANANASQASVAAAAAGGSSSSEREFILLHCQLQPIAAAMSKVAASDVPAAAAVAAPAAPAAAAAVPMQVDEAAATAAAPPAASAHERLFSLLDGSNVLSTQQKIAGRDAAAELQLKAEKHAAELADLRQKHDALVAKEKERQEQHDKEVERVRQETTEKLRKETSERIDSARTKIADMYRNAYPDATPQQEQDHVNTFMTEDAIMAQANLAERVEGLVKAAAHKHTAAAAAAELTPGERNLAAYRQMSAAAAVAAASGSVPARGQEQEQEEQKQQSRVAASAGSTAFVPWIRQQHTQRLVPEVHVMHMSQEGGDEEKQEKVKASHAAVSKYGSAEVMMGYPTRLPPASMIRASATDMLDPYGHFASGYNGKKRTGSNRKLTPYEQAKLKSEPQQEWVGGAGACFDRTWMETQEQKDLWLKCRGGQAGGDIPFDVKDVYSPEFLEGIKNMDRASSMSFEQNGIYGIGDARGNRWWDGKHGLRTGLPA